MQHVDSGTLSKTDAIETSRIKVCSFLRLDISFQTEQRRELLNSQSNIKQFSSYSRKLPEMANTLSFKCYLLANNGQDKEIRRFALESDIIGNFTYLKEKVRSVFPQLLRENFNILYVDEEGDKVTISSDDELVAALMFVKRKDDEPFRLIIQVSGGAKTEAESTTTAPTGNCQGEIHWGVTCDGCKGVVKGFRYKCFQCPDFDLCGKCETAGIHPGHVLLRVTGPVPASFQTMRQLLHSGTEIPHWRRKHHGRHHPHGHHGWNAWCPSGMNVEVDPPASTEGCKKEAGNKEEKQCPYKFYMDQAKETASTFQALHPEYLAGLGNTIASVMESFGLGLNSTGQSCPRSASAQKPETKKEDVAKEETKVETEKPKAEAKKNEVIIPITVEKEEQVPANTYVTSPYAGLADAIAAARAAELACAQATTESPNQETKSIPAQSAPHPIEAVLAAQAAEAATKQLMADDSQKTETVSTPPKSQSPSRECGDWTIVDSVEKVSISSPSETAATPVPSPSPAPSPSLGARPKSPQQQPTVVKTPAHPDPFIAAALETMLAMGFTNEGGWLAQLLEVKGGDIGKALDVLQSRFQRQQQ